MIENLCCAASTAVAAGNGNVFVRKQTFASRVSMCTGTHHHKTGHRKQHRNECTTGERKRARIANEITNAVDAFADRTADCLATLPTPIATAGASFGYGIARFHTTSSREYCSHGELLRGTYAELPHLHIKEIKKTVESQRKSNMGFTRRQCCLALQYTNEKHMGLTRGIWFLLL